jgi:hypothetical protein
MPARLGQRAQRHVYTQPETAMPFDDTRMGDTGLARNGGPSLYYGFTAVDGGGPVTVYNSWQGTGSNPPIHTVASPTPGVFYAVPGEVVSCDGVYAVQGVRNVDYRID